MISEAIGANASGGPVKRQSRQSTTGRGNPGFTTGEGLNALKNLTSGIGNSALGWHCLFSDTTASYNTGLGAGILTLNTGGGEYCQRRRRAHPEHGRDEEHREWSRCDGVQQYRQR